MPKYEIVQGRVCGTCQYFRRHYVGVQRLIFMPSTMATASIRAEKTNQRANVRALVPQGTAASSVKRAPVRMGGTHAPCARAAFDSVSCRCVRKPRLQIAR